MPLWRASACPKQPERQTGVVNGEILLSKNVGMHVFFTCFYSVTELFSFYIFFLFRITVLPLSVDYLHLFAAENKKNAGEVHGSFAV